MKSHWKGVALAALAVGAACAQADEARARKIGITDLDRIYKLEDLAKGDVIFAATGVTDGSLLEGVRRYKSGRITTESIVMRASSGTVRRVEGDRRGDPA